MGIIKIRQSTIDNRQLRHGFSLIELLVVIAIISLLVSILLPLLSRAKELARRVVCSTNMRQVGIGFTMYISDWQGWFPVIRDASHQYYWSDKIHDPYVNDAKVFHCPAVPDRIFTPDVIYGSDPMAYGMSWKLGGGPSVGYDRHKLTQITQPFETVLLGENNSYHHGYGVHNIESVPWGLPDDNRHGGESNILFVDGHVAPFTSDDALGQDSNLVWY